MTDIVIVDIGFGNVRSMLNAVVKVARDDQQVHLTRDLAAIESAERLVISGVGAFAECKKKLDASGLLPSIQKVVDAGRPLLGVCVGMQIMADVGLEFGRTAGLSWIPGTVRALDAGVGEDGRARKLPHVGWTPVQGLSGPMFEGIEEGTHLYFVHSYCIEPENPEHVAARACYGETFTAAVLRDNVFGCQFHPERSGELGLTILERFCRWSP